VPAIFLRYRRDDLSELMDSADCDPELLENTYRQFGAINRLFSGWRGVYKNRIRPLLRAGRIRVLDIGCGGGDLAVQLSLWARSDQLDIHITAADPNPGAFRYLSSRELPGNVVPRKAYSRDLLADGEKYDIVLSNHVLHHLSVKELRSFLIETSELASFLVLHNDIRRDDLAFAGFLPVGLFFRRSFIFRDGLTSIRRSWRPDELIPLLPDGWYIESNVMYRNHVIWEA